MAGTLRPEGSIDEKYGLLDSYINVLEKEGQVVRKEGIENEIRKEMRKKRMGDGEVQSSSMRIGVENKIQRINKEEMRKA